ncbi:HlyD family type I secretion periplasmic adaptor subunit [Aurantivibrio infirmus]
MTEKNKIEEAKDLAESSEAGSSTAEKDFQEVQQQLASIAVEAPKPPGFIRRCLDTLLERWMPSAEPDVLEWQEDAERAMVDQDPVRTKILLYVIVLGVVGLIVWSAFAEIDEVTRGDGKVIPSQQIQIIQSLDGGVVTDILVKEGDIVEANQLLFSLDKTRFASSFREKEIELLALQVRAKRLLAIAEGTEFEISEEIKQQIPDVVSQETILYRSSLDALNAEKNIASEQLSQRQEELNEAIAKRNQLRESFSLADRELNMTRPLVSSGAVSQVELLRLEREVNNLQGEQKQTDAQVQRLTSTIAEARQKILEVELIFKNLRREELTEVTTRINGLRESNLGLSDRVKQTEIRAPVRGTVKQLFFNTVGGVVLPGKEVLELVPLDDTLLLEARIRPQDIAFLTPGQEATVKFTAYDFVVYGGLEAVVEHIGADTVMDEDGNPFYSVRVRTLKSSLGEDKPIIPGMVAGVDILTGKKTILAYFMKPVLRAKQYALSER